MTSESGKITALLIGGTGATGKEVLKELNANDLVSKIIFISRRALEFPDQPKVRIHLPSLIWVGVDISQNLFAESSKL